ncbi:uncharacterized protein MYCFIDRAFT_160824 [Pseudocercospora fijiensis CIRAD86]|uniref:Uncharacterized protein n=1 Tax=Pseudocercospora fijiensis (strain CIRAD86) TaxID=383855 RepID=N1Q9R9_PSEFD|nr:uncharacterized protein MYCFIDRAFT_160824 [Pseudocercospora fijiensis CIRAD86]EME89640.1 hypothetical protein MYCFIDRAFT_160824 [Pseudocercospora fijiensis CIRAD86]
MSAGGLSLRPRFLDCLDGGVETLLLMIRATLCDTGALLWTRRLFECESGERRILRLNKRRGRPRYFLSIPLLRGTCALETI